MGEKGELQKFLDGRSHLGALCRILNGSTPSHIIALFYVCDSVFLSLHRYHGPQLHPSETSASGQGKILRYVGCGVKFPRGQAGSGW